MAKKAMTESDKTAGSNSKDLLPDVSEESLAHVSGTLDQVGMQGMEVSIRWPVGEGDVFLLPAKADIFISLDDPEQKGIHMSRLYLEVKNCFDKEPLSPQVLKKVLSQTILSQGSSFVKRASLSVEFVAPVERKSLVSEQYGWRQYPITMKGELIDGDFHYTLGAKVLYSSTCPCSAALSRQMNEAQFRKDFQGQSEISMDEISRWLTEDDSATPHAQRSEALFKVKIKDSVFSPSPLEFVDRVESCLGTPVQAAVKRPDEQEFAKMNGRNLMYCEDAARKIKTSFESDHQVEDYLIRVEHQESLHPHNAVSVVTKGVPGGFQV